MNKKNLSIIYWNCYFQMQCGWLGDGSAIAQRLNALIIEKSPQILCLNEVVVEKSGNSKIIDILQKHDYRLHITKNYEIKTDIFVNNVVAYRHISKPKISDYPLVGRIKPSDKLYQDYMAKVGDVRFAFGGANIQVMNLHLCALVSLDLIAHIEQRRVLKKILSQYATQNLILGGDFNEFKYMPWWLLHKKGRVRLTGNFLKPTWVWRFAKLPLLMTCYDNIIFDKNADFKLYRFQVLDRKPSDHTPLYVEFEVG